MEMNMVRKYRRPDTAAETLALLKKRLITKLMGGWGVRRGEEGEEEGGRGG